MTAASDSVAAEDRSHLTEMPQVSDYMHLEKVPGRYFSFHRLPSGSWALSQRFTYGMRRRSYNRIVVHTLVVSDELLERVLADAWLLVAVCRFQHPTAGWRAFTELAELVGEPGVREISDLPVQPPGDPQQARLKMLEQRCSFLKRHWGSEETLSDALGQVLGAVEAGHKVLLPQEMVMEQLQALAWSSLPRQDRLRVHWTTHLATGAGAIFHLALAPSPSDARHQQNDPGRWFLLGDPAKSSGGGGEALAAALSFDFDKFPTIDQGLSNYELSLCRPDELAGWIQWTIEGGQLPPSGFADARDLAAFLRRHRLVGEASVRWPWLKSGRLLEPVALTVVNQLSSGSDWEEAVEAVSKVLEARDLLGSLLDTAQVAELIEWQGGRREAQIALAALALLLAAGYESDRVSREVLLAALMGRGALAQNAGLQKTSVLPCFAESVVQVASDKAEMAYQVVQENGSLDAAIGRLEPSLRYLTNMRAILRVARTSKNHVIAEKVAREFLVPVLAMDPVQARVGNLGKDVLNSLRSAPEGLVQVFEEWKNEELYDEAVQTLRQWASEEASNAAAAALTVSKRLASKADLIRERRSILGISQVLADAQAPAADWLAFALAEASLIDELQDKQALRSFRTFLARASINAINPAELTPPIKKLLSRFHRAPSPATLREAHRALVIALAVPLSQFPIPAAEALKHLEKLEQADFLYWAGAVSEVARQIAQKEPNIASAIACRWWLANKVAATHEESFPQGAIDLLNLLDKKHAVVVLDRWAPLFRAFGRNPRIQTLLDRFHDLARRYELQDLEFQCAVGRMAWMLGGGSGDLAGAVQETLRRAAHLNLSDAHVASALARLLPQDDVEAAKAIFNVLVAPRLSPEAKLRVRKPLLDRALRVVPRNSVQVIPPVDELQGDNTLLLAVARGLGERWREWFWDALPFVRRLIELERFDSLGEFFEGVRSSGREGFVRSVENCDRDLYREMRRAAKHPVARVDLARVDALR